MTSTPTCDGDLEIKGMVDKGPTMWDKSGQEVLGWLFVEFPSFTRIWENYFLTDAALAIFQSHIARSPTAGDLIPGCGGLRKLRWPDPRRGKGRRGGLRAIYMLVPEIRVVVLVDVYDKDEASDLSASEKKILAGLARDARIGLLNRFHRS